MAVKRKKAAATRQPATFRLQAETHVKIDEIAEALSAETGAETTRTDAVEIAVNDLWKKTVKKSK